MLPGERDIVMRQEQYQDLRREAKQEWLIQIARSQQPGQRQWSHYVPNLIGLVILWIGTRLVRWGLKLQGCNPTPL